MSRAFCHHHQKNNCPPRIDGHNQYSPNGRATPLLILAVVEDHAPVTLKELPALVDTATEATVIRACYRLIAAGELEVVNGHLRGTK